MIMAKINNAQIIQKLIDELKLYPGTDVIPTELAEKILPVYQVNDQAINFSETGARRYLVSSVAGNVVHTTTVPAGKKWRLDLLSFILISDVNAANRRPWVIIKDDSGNIITGSGNNDASLGYKQVASKTITYILAQGNLTNGGTSIAGFQTPNFQIDEGQATIMALFQLPLMSRNLVLLPGWTISVEVDSGQAGDNLKVLMQVNQEENDYTS